MAILLSTLRERVHAPARAREQGPAEDEGVQAARREHARGAAAIVAAAASLVLFSLFMPPPSQVAQYALLAGSLDLYCCAFVLMRRPQWASRRVLVTACAGASAGTGVVVGVVMNPETATGVAILDRTDMLLGVSLIVGAVVMIRTLLRENAHRLTQLSELARTDQLTGIANRRAWDEALDRELARAGRRRRLCVALADLDRFKLYNDLRGHQSGDQFLLAAATVWRAELGDRGLLARFGGEEFAILMPGVGIDEATLIAHRLRAVVPEEQTCSVGIAQWEPGESGDDLLRRADNALYDAKMGGRDRIRVAPRAADDMPQRQQEAWTSVIRRVLTERTLVSAYQPIIRLADGVVVAYEALARPDRSRLDISVEQMFSVAQRCGVARELDWLCRCAALEGATGLPKGMPLFINCNVSTLLDPVHRVDEMLAAAEAARRRPQEIVLEITERELVGDLDRLRDVVIDHRDHGFRFAIDDVGEGHSTLEVLAACAPEFIKIARSLVVDALSRGPRAAIRAVVAFAEESGSLVIAEGIESDANALLMRRLGVDLAQGFFFAKPGLPVQTAPLLSVS